MSMPKSVKAAILTEFGKPLQIQDLPVPVLEPGAALVRIEASTVCGTDVHISRGDYAGRDLARLPLVLGHEMVGRIVELGEGRNVDALNRPLRAGDLICWSYAWCGQCYWCAVTREPTSCENPRFYGWGPADRPPYIIGGFAEYAYVMPRCGIVKVPDGLDPAVASSVTCAGRTVVHGFDSLGRVLPTDTVVIQGSGPVGLYALALSVESGAEQTILFGAPSDRLRIGQRWGASATFDVRTTTSAEREEYVRDVTRGRGADKVIECSGAAEAMPEGLQLLRKGGRYVLLGVGGMATVPIDKDLIALRQLSIVGAISGDVSHYYRALEFVVHAGDRYDFSELLGRRYGLGEVNEAISAMASSAEMKPVVVPQGG